MGEDTESEQLVVELLKEFEGFRAEPYPDPATGGAPWTIGYGSTTDLSGKPVTRMTAAITEAQAHQLALRDVVAAFKSISQALKVPLTPHEKAAIEDFIYNVGSGNFLSSTLLKLINQGEFALAAKQFEKWTYANGKVMAGLLRRRLVEEQLFLT
jgi:lysozyme